MRKPASRRNDVVPWSAAREVGFDAGSRTAPDRQAFRRDPRAERCRSGDRARRGAGPDGRQRRRQIDAGQGSWRATSRPPPARSDRRRRRSISPSPSRRARRASRSSIRTSRSATTCRPRPTCSSAARSRRGSGPFRWLDHAAMAKRAGELFGELKSETRPRDLVRQMSGGQRQAVAIARTRLSKAKVVLMDEPTAAISVRQVAEVLDLIRRLRDSGMAVILISHRMPDVFEVCDRVAVMRRGRKVADKPIADDEPGRSDRPHHGSHPCRLKARRREPRCRPRMPRSTLDPRRARALGAAGPRRVAAVLGDGGARRDLRRHGLSAARIVRDLRQLLQHHPQLLLHRHHGARHDGGDRDRRHRSFGRLDHGARGGGLRRSSCRPAIRGGWRCWAGSAAGGARAARSTACWWPYVGLSSFVVTLGMLSVARSVAVVLSGNRMIYNFGPGGPAFK